MENEIVDLNVLFLNLNNIFQVLFTIYIPTINAAFVPKVHRSFCTCRTVGFFLRLEKAYASVVFFLRFCRIDVGMSSMELKVGFFHVSSAIQQQINYNFHFNYDYKTLVLITVAT